MAIQPIRPQDASGIYRQTAVSTGGVAQSAAERQRSASASGGGRKADSVSLSQEAQELRRVLAAVRDLPDTREARIGHIREQLANGVYSRDVATIAERMIEEGVI